MPKLPGAEPEVAFVIVTFNSAGQVAQCLRSIARQRLHRARIVVVDNASTDETISVIRQTGIGLTLIENRTNRGFAAACNQAVEAVGEEFVLLLNPDARLSPGAVSTLVDAVVSSQEIGIAGPRILDESGALIPSAYRLPTLFQELAFLFRLKPILLWGPVRVVLGPLLMRRFGQFDPHRRRKVVESVVGSCLLVRRDVWERLSGFDEGFFLFYEEKDFCKRAAEAGYKTLFVPEAKVIHSVGASVKSAPRFAAVAKRASMIYYYQKHKSLLANLAVRAALLATVVLSVARDVVGFWAGYLSAGELGRRLAASCLLCRIVSRPKEARSEVMRARSVLIEG